MTPSRVRSRVVADRILWIGRMLDEIRALPAGSESAFLSDRRNVWAAESCLRRALEALSTWDATCSPRASGRE